MTGPETSWLGRLSYRGALQMQEAAVADRLADRRPDRLFLLEHDAVYTIGRQRDRSSLGPAPLPHPVEEINRGGQATYHGPGQLVGYFIFDLQKLTPDLHVFLRWIEESLIALLAAYGLDARRREGLTGVWVDDRKVASIGVGVRRWVTMHGFGLNVGSDLSGFTAITPCGIQGVTMTSLSREVGTEVSAENAANEAKRIFADRYPLLRPSTLNAKLHVTREPGAGGSALT
jgi:lipoyl(octanoyl) transferase